MAFIKRRRFIFWLVKAYVKKSGRTILFSFFIGLAVFFLLKLSFNFFLSKITLKQKTVIGVVGAYTVDTLPNTILGKVSRGLTMIGSDSQPMVDIAESWTIKDSGQTYIFKLKHDVYFSDGKNLTSNDINYGFSDVKVERPDEYTIDFKLKDSYAPFLITVSRPVFTNDFAGVGEYRVKDIKVNGNFVESLSLASKSDSNKMLEYQFYPTEDSVKIAYALGEVDQVSNLSNVRFQNTDFAHFANTEVSKNVDYRELVTAFYNTKDKDLGDKRIREAMRYAIPNSFSEGKRNYTPFTPTNWVNKDEDTSYEQDLGHAKQLLIPVLSGTSNAKLSFSLKTLPEYIKTAETLSKYWEQIGIHTKIEASDTIPANYQIFLGKFMVPKDPDQYSLWHSDQQNNITYYKNLRIDKLLEDGRKTADIESRKKIYQDFEKYLLDDPPASFLFFPYTYSINRK